MTTKAVAPVKYPKMKIKKGDLVEVITGAAQRNGGDRGKQGKVIAVYPERSRVLVEGVNRVKRHTKTGTSGRGTKTGGIVTQEAAIHVSNVMLVDPDTKKRTRVGLREDTVTRDGVERVTRVRFAKRSGKDI
jgi:large subunit ribosomal protein L24